MIHLKIWKSVDSEEKHFFGPFFSCFAVTDEQ